MKSLIFSCLKINGWSLERTVNDFLALAENTLTNNVTLTGFFNHWHVSFLWLLVFDLAYAEYSKATICIMVEFKTGIKLGLGIKCDVEKIYPFFHFGFHCHESIQRFLWDFSQGGDRVFFWRKSILKIDGICSRSSIFHACILLFFYDMYVLDRIKLLHPTCIYKFTCFSAYCCERVNHT